MRSKTIIVSDEAFNALKRKQRKKESFSDLILRLTSDPAQKDIQELAGSWKGTKVESEKLSKMIEENREKMKQFLT